MLGIVISWALWAAYAFVVIKVDLRRQRARALAENDDMYLEPDVSGLVYVSVLLCIPATLPLYFGQARKSRGIGVLIGLGWALLGFVIVTAVSVVLHLTGVLGPTPNF